MTKKYRRGLKIELLGESARCCLEQYGLCLLPNVPMSLECRSDAYATFEHLLPLGRKGTNERTNLALSHKKCNHARGERLLPGISPPVREPYVPKVPDRLIPFTSAWLAHRGYMEQEE